MAVTLEKHPTQQFLAHHLRQAAENRTNCLNVRCQIMFEETLDDGPLSDSELTAAIEMLKAINPGR